MAGIARLDTPGLLHHVMIRGIERRKIFNDDKDREVRWSSLPLTLVRHLQKQERVNGRFDHLLSSG